ncbi:PTS sugar transporter subunit IIA [Anaerosinus massiliensis]|uniref:PTS sugar transporter subunit IIA n=1 Tax=Massilibacillus massiliensis TaxID=1806837 RepID=UPI000A3E557D|nr:PTS sugar transporter subunit IIA [Massilibacillus massiliensis]
MFQNLIQKKRCCFHKGFKNWEDAVRAACLPLLIDQTIEPEYPDAIIEKVKELGPYIVIAPKICIPHAQEGVGVNDTAVCFMKTEEPIHFSDDPDHDAQLFFVLASVDNGEHLENLCELSELLSDETVVEKLLAAKSIEDLKELP